MKDFYDIQKRSDLTWAEKIAVINFRHSQLEQYECPVVHLFEDGWYIREMSIPKGTVFIGRPHVRGHKVELVKGTILHFEEGKKTTRKAPYSLMTTPNYQAVFLTATPVIGRTYHPDNGERDLDVLDAQIFVPISAVLALGERVQMRLAA